MFHTAEDIFISAEACCFLSYTSRLFFLLYRLINPLLKIVPNKYTLYKW